MAARSTRRNRRPQTSDVSAACDDVDGTANIRSLQHQPLFRTSVLGNGQLVLLAFFWESNQRRPDHRDAPPDCTGRALFYAREQPPTASIRRYQQQRHSILNARELAKNWQSLVAIVRPFLGTQLAAISCRSNAQASSKSTTRDARRTVPPGAEQPPRI